MMATDAPSTKPYLIRALHQWCTDFGFTPFLAVFVDERVEVPMEFVKNNEIVLNISADACHQLHIENDWISFQARFGGVPRSLRVPVIAVHSIYARESGEGLVFPPESDGPPTLGDSATIGSGPADEPTRDPPTPPTPRRPSLKVVK